MGWKELGQTGRAREGRGRFSRLRDPDLSDQGHSDRGSRRRRTDKSTEAGLREHFKAEATSARRPSGSATRRDSPVPSKARGSSATGSGQQDMDVGTNAAATSHSPDAHSRDGPSDPSGPSSSSTRKQHEFLGTQRIVKKGLETHVVPTRLELAATYAPKRSRNWTLDIVSET